MNRQLAGIDRGRDRKLADCADRYGMAVGRLALNWRERGLASCPLQFDFLGNCRNGVTDLFDDRLQRISRYIEPPGPGTNLNWLCQVDLVADGRMFDALHDGTVG